LLIAITTNSLNEKLGNNPAKQTAEYMKKFMVDGYWRTKNW
jgi:hypothetical protein